MPRSKRVAKTSARDASAPYSFKPRLSRHEIQGRASRGQTERMFLLSAEKEDFQPWKFRVQGIRGTTYNLSFDHGDRGIWCSCPDFTFRGNACKHMFFICGQVAKHGSGLSCMQTNGSLNETTFNELDACLEMVLASRMGRKKGTDTASSSSANLETHTPTKPPYDPEDVCSICYEGLGTAEAMVSCVSQCHNYFHSSCMERWLSHSFSSKKCPMCRVSWQQPQNLSTARDGSPHDALEHFNEN